MDMDGQLPYRIVHSDYSGRSLAATRDLPAGYQLIQEQPLIVGPCASSAPVCLSCHAPVSTLVRCCRCQWPVCSQDCADDPVHLAECQVLVLDTRGIGVPTSDDPTPRYDLILIVRCLLLKQRNPKQWEKLLSLESHWEQRKKDAEAHHMAAVKYFTKVCPTEHDEDTIHKVRGIILTNCINSRTRFGINLRGIYPTVSLLNHSCVPSIALRSDENGQLFVHTAVDLVEDDQLTFCYVPPADPYWKRQKDLHDIYYFTCSCERCTDRTELGLHFSSLKCEKCKKAFIDPMLNKKKIYRCTSCRYSLYQVKVMHISISLQVLYSKQEQIVDVSSAMTLLKLIHERGHGKHYTWLACAGVILQALGKKTGVDALRLRKQLWMRVIDMYSLLEPGMTRRRGVSLLQLASVSVLLAIQDFNIGRIPKAGLTRQIEICEEQLSEARQILELEPPASTEQRWLMMEEKERRRLEEVKERLEDMVEGRQHIDTPENSQESEDSIRQLEEVFKEDTVNSDDSDSSGDTDKEDGGGEALEGT